jgi:hypothetical protein
VQIDLSEDEAVVVFEWLSDFDVEAIPSAERAALNGLLSALERVLAAPFRSDYADVLAAARVRLSTDT